MPESKLKSSSKAVPSNFGTSALSARKSKSPTRFSALQKGASPTSKLSGTSPTSRITSARTKKPTTGMSGYRPKMPQKKTNGTSPTHRSLQPFSKAMGTKLRTTNKKSPARIATNLNGQSPGKQLPVTMKTSEQPSNFSPKLPAQKIPEYELGSPIDNFAPDMPSFQDQSITMTHPNMTLKSAPRAEKPLPVTEFPPAQKIEELPLDIRLQIAELIDRKVQEKLGNELENLKLEGSKAVEWQRGQHEVTIQKNMRGKLGDQVNALQSYSHHQGNFLNPFLGHPQGGYGYPYGHLGHINRESLEEDWMMDSQMPQISPRQRTALNYETDNTVKLAVDTADGVKENEFVLKKMDRGAEVQARRKAYDAHVKADIYLTGRGSTMNKTYDPYYHHDPRMMYGHGHGYPYGLKSKMQAEDVSKSQISSLKKQAY